MSKKQLYDQIKFLVAVNFFKQNQFLAQPISTFGMLTDYAKQLQEI